MAEPHVISALVKKRAELSGDIERTHEQLRQMVMDLENLDNTTHMFDPDYQVEAIKPKAFRPPKDWSNRGEMTRICLSILNPSQRAISPLNCWFPRPRQERYTAAQDHDKACRRGPTRSARQGAGQVGTGAGAVCALGDFQIRAAYSDNSSTVFGKD